MHRTKRGFTLIELLVVIAIIALLIGLLLPALAKAQQNAKSLKDKSQIRQVHTAMIIHSQDNRDKLPTPGLVIMVWRCRAFRPPSRHRRP